MALRATWPIAAVIVKGIQSDVTVNIRECGYEKRIRRDQIMPSAITM
jgi:hypothetical protein